MRWFVFDAEALTHVDATGMDALTSLVQSLGEEAVTFVFARLKDPMRQASARPACWISSASRTSTPPSEPPSRPPESPVDQDVGWSIIPIG